jgi:c(7)-type cytochrome triheme protein
MTRSIALAASLAICFAVSTHADDAAVKKRRTPPQEYGRVVLNNHSQKAKMPGVVFDHWLHRAKYTCRVCHVDIGFAMQPGATDIRAADNAKGQYCGACHNDRTKTDDGSRVFASCSIPAALGRPTCTRCHSIGTSAQFEYDFASFTKNLPRGRFGNGIDWEAAEDKQLIKPVDFVEGISIRRASISAQKDFALSAKLEGMPDIIFSHAKHTVWSGCEGCHPEIFVGVKKGATKYSMVDIFQGKSCGACHVTVAFPTIDCQRCHSKPVQ